jgi:hypothetical protein
MPNPMSRDSTRFVALFQKAHGSIANVQRLDDQIAALFEQRRKALDEMRAVQSQINTEFDRMLELDRVVPADTLLAAEAGGKPKDSKPSDLRSTRADNAVPQDDEELSPPRFGRNSLPRFQPQLSGQG